MTGISILQTNLKMQRADTTEICPGVTLCFSCLLIRLHIINMQFIFKKLVQEILLLLLSLQPMRFGLLNPIILGFSFPNELDQISQF